MNQALHIEPRKHSFGLTALAVVVLWFLLALAGSLLGVFGSAQRPPLALGVAASLPVVAFSIAYFASTGFREAVVRANLRLITLAHTWRIGGVVFLILYQRGTLPGSFALPAGWGDIAIGVTAPLVALAIARGGLGKPVFVVWNVLGLLDLVTAV